MNMQALMQQAQRMQKDMMKKKGEIDNKEFVGKSEWVEVVFTGAKVLKSVKITKNDSIEADDMEVLEDMIKIFLNKAKVRHFHTNCLPKVQPSHHNNQSNFSFSLLYNRPHFCVV